MTPWTLRTRLALLAAFAIGFLLVATFVAWRLARTTDAFAIRQAESDVQRAVAQLARDLQEFPSGRTALGDGPRGRGSAGRGGPPPHERQAFQLFSDPLTRSSAIALHPLADVAGGFVRRDGALVGYAFPARAGTPPGTQPSDDARAALGQMITAALAQQSPVVRTTFGQGSLTIAAAAPLGARQAEESGLVAAVAVKSLRSMSAATDPTNLLAAAGLVVIVGLVIGFGLFTIREVQRGVRAIESGLDTWTTLDEPMPAPSMPEFARIAGAINAVALQSRDRRERELALERQLHQQEHLAALGRVVAAVAHEVRNPLAAMKLKAQMAARAGYSAERFGDTTRVIVEEIDRLDRLVRRLLELGHPPLVRRAPVDLCEIVRDRLALMREQLTKQGVDVVVDDPSGGLWIDADADRLAQVFDNVLQNAFEAMPRSGRLTVTYGKDAPGVRAIVSLHDTGPGVLARDRGHLFEPFYSRRDGGTGLGLAIAREIVEAHGGHIVVEDTVSPGATFRMDFPLIGSRS